MLLDVLAWGIDDYMHLFMVEKFTADSKHDKYKSHLVKHDNKQDAMIYADWSSSMVVM